MSKTVTVDPITRIEGHGKIALTLDDGGRVTDARFCVREFRGFEKFCEGTPAERLPLLTSRICGICPVSHHLASTKAVEAALGAKIPPAAAKLRELLFVGQLIESHILSLAVLSLPDLALGKEPPERRNVLGLYATGKEAVRKVLALRAVGTAIVSVLGRRPGHPIGAVIGGAAAPLSEEERASLLEKWRAAESLLPWVAGLLRPILEKNAETIPALGSVGSAYMGLSRNGSLSFYDGDVAVLSADGAAFSTFPPERYFDHVEEKIENWSYMKFPVFKSGERFRVGPLARINIVERIPTPLADQELKEFRKRWPRPAHHTLLYHNARLIEFVYAFERAKELLEDPEITSKEVFRKPEKRAGTGVGIVEAPRGTLVHCYELDGNGRSVSVDILVATQHNNFGFNDSLKAAAGSVIKGPDPDEASLNTLESVVRAYDPCLSCATHVLGGRPFRIELFDREGNLLKEWR